MGAVVRSQRVYVTSAGLRIETHYEASSPVNSGPAIVSYAVETYGLDSRRSHGGTVVKFTNTMLGARFGAWWRERFA